MAKQTSVKQRRKRRAKHVKRVEFVLYADNDRDLAIYNHLVQLTRHNEASDFIKDALYRAIAGQGDQPPASAEPNGGVDWKAIQAEIADLKRELKRRPAAPPLPLPSTPPTMHDSSDQGSTASAPAPDGDKYGGLDMSRRRRAGPPKVISPAPTPAAATVLDPRAARDQLVASILSFTGTQ